MARLEMITRAGYQVYLQWECEFERYILPQHTGLKARPLVHQAPLNTPVELTGVAQKSCASTTKIVKAKQFTIAMLRHTPIYASVAYFVCATR
jgi:hypothetical protein